MLMELSANSIKDRSMPTYAAGVCGLRASRNFFAYAILIAMAALSIACGGSGASAADAGAPGGGGKGGGRKGGGGDVPVTVAKATKKDVPVEVQVIGNVEAFSTIAVKSQITGELLAVHFHEGDFVKRGDTLFEIDRRPLEASLNQATANTLRDQAALGQAQ